MGILFSLFRNANFSFEFSELQDLLETLQNFFFEPSELSEWFRTFILPKNTFKDTLKLNTFSILQSL
ncbi:hypothetical protein RhiirA5_362227 [Rhizophagus irregularis]|uniref:Uncharacterized protein n=2 Tax=Rhizophagus irregularis TaxID=588596 RepID=U9UFM1_RHIID|nr:hypothetical protein GLOIN_2v1522243 [Rhizophagus irregularis DAOM 181602=DAOM 197198]PKC04560.1 hypothetical protein RhiirA5_362227 [Rhizophagus irregularis]PKC61312.1 hypothetical protein RhiirA1_424982 [Rhizophagus irregularis]PKC68260.1 hypothetical protein RhiirA1_417096 [Rhizophagus irregularis]PKY22799.1 hypothetical protein RhiirB3_411048 [Rhizophagus irregularis]POG79924.1 hypothetical protein GLOIN_2v1522243 [Rhizophagus irregularis DAOM 181602=DAOM 197198]|eukprot:XP_025186790.1 hypothetical protein GLOIN_2v1522243 [Rhizophagus irregularis DAOM 181602=DAOM 197198]